MLDIPISHITIHSPVMAISLTPIAVSLEVEPELEDVVVEVAAEAALVRVLPLAVDDLEGDVLVGRPRVEPQHGELRVVRTYFL